MLSLFLSVIEDECDQEKFEKIYYAYHDEMLRISYSITKNERDAEFVLSDVFFGISKKISDIDDSDPVKLRVYTIKATRNAAINFIKKKTRNNAVNIDDVFDLNLADKSIDMLNSIENKELCLTILKKINSMPFEYRDVLTMHYLHDYSVNEIADLLQRKKNTVKTQLKRGTEMLCKFIEEAGIND